MRFNWSALFAAMSSYLPGMNSAQIFSRFWESTVESGSRRRTTVKPVGGTSAVAISNSGLYFLRHSSSFQTSPLGSFAGGGNAILRIAIVDQDGGSRAAVFFQVDEIAQREFKKMHSVNKSQIHQVVSQFSPQVMPGKKLITGQLEQPGSRRQRDLHVGGRINGHATR